MRVLALLALAGNFASAQSVTIDKTAGLPHDRVWDLCATEDGAVWVATGGGLARITPYVVEGAESVGASFGVPAPTRPVLRLEVTQAGTIVGLEPGLRIDSAGRLRFLGKGSVRFVELPGGAHVADELVVAGEEILVQVGRKLHVLRGDSWEPVVWPARIEELPRWFWSEKGPGIAAPKAFWIRASGRWQKAGGDTLEEDGKRRRPIRGTSKSDLYPPTVWHEGREFVATTGGVRVTRWSPVFSRIRLPDATRVQCLARDREGGIWCGTENGVVRVLGDEVQSWTEIGGRAIGTVTACVVDERGRVWIGSGSSFTGVYRKEGDAWKHFGAAQGFVDAYVHRITRDPAGPLWFSTLNRDGASYDAGEGPWVFADGAFRQFAQHPELPSDRVYDVVVRDRSGLLWFATLRGLASYDGRAVRQLGPEHGLLGEKVWCLHVAADGGLWIGYQKGGHGASRVGDGRVMHYNRPAELSGGDVWSIAEGPAGVLWFATRTGLHRYDGRRWSRFTKKEGLPDAALWPLLPLPDGSLWIGTLGEGPVRLDPRDRDSPRTRFHADAPRVREDGSVVVSWTGVDRWYETPSEALWFRFRFDGGDWHPFSPASEVTFPGDSRRHRIEVQALDRFGNLEEVPASFEWRLERNDRSPALWRWIAVASAGLLGAVWILVRRRSAPTHRP